MIRRHCAELDAIPVGVLSQSAIGRDCRAIVCCRAAFTVDISAGDDETAAESQARGGRDLAAYLGQSEYEGTRPQICHDVK